MRYQEIQFQSINPDLMAIWQSAGTASEKVQAARQIREALEQSRPGAILHRLCLDTATCIWLVDKPS